MGKKNTTNAVLPNKVQNSFSNFFLIQFHTAMTNHLLKFAQSNQKKWKTKKNFSWNATNMASLNLDNSP